MHCTITNTTRGIALGLVLAMGALQAPPAFADEQAGGVDIQLLDSSQEHSLIDYLMPTVPGFTKVMIDGTEYSIPLLGNEASAERFPGAPDLPDVVRSLRIPNKSRMQVTVTEAEYYEMEDVIIAPARGPITRDLDPAAVPYDFGDQYQIDAFWPQDIATLGDPWIMRDQRGVDLRITPFQYNPVRKTLRVYTNVQVKVSPDGPGEINVLPEDFQCGNRMGWTALYRAQFLNWDLWVPPIFIPLDPEMLVIVPENWEDEIQPLVDHHNANGLWTIVDTIEEIGNDHDSIKDHIRDRWEEMDISYVLLVGDHEHVTSRVEAVTTSGATDPDYMLLAGDDAHPEVLVGRFSAQTDEDVETQVERTIAYENAVDFFATWRKNGLGIASNDGGGNGDDNEWDWEHLDNIRDLLLDAGYTRVDQVYDHGAVDDDVRDSISNDVGVINYTGHGNWDKWNTSGFNNADVDALENTNRLPWIISVACQNGRFNDRGSCFAERWLRATDSEGNPAGAVAAFMSTVNQHWKEPMEAQDTIGQETADGRIKRFGNLCAAGTADMVSKYDDSGVEMLRTWTIFGDPALNLHPRELKLDTSFWVPWWWEFGAPPSADPPPNWMKVENLTEEPRVLEFLWIEPWLVVDPPVLMLLPGESREIEVSLDPEAAETMAAGRYTASIVMHDMVSGTTDQGRLCQLEVEEACTGDIDGDGSIGIMDLLDVLEQWGPCSTCDADLDGNGTVDIMDLLTVLAGWGSC